ncbi:MAG: hypothetical protein BIFFINMI_03142 [Phycisphaerae bacterium]|nr:hypothetical protein [Phycisphaerae bacterium]
MMRSARWILGLAGALAAAAWPATARAAEPDAGPVQIVPLKVLTRSGNLYVRGSMKQKKETFGGGSDSNQKDTYLEEGVDLQSTGYIYHPNLMEWFAAFRLGLTQQQIDLNETQEKFRGTLLGFDLSGLLLQKKRVSARVFASRTQNQVDRNFAARLEVIQSRFGVELIRRGKFPITLLLEQLGLTEKDEQRNDDQTSRHARFTVSDQRNSDHFTELILDLLDVTETITNIGDTTSTTEDASYRQLEALLNTVHRFGSGTEKNRFAASGRLRDRTGYFPEREMDLDASLDLVHSPTLTSFYHAAYHDNRTDTDQDKTTTLDAGFAKQIYESLNIAGRGNWTSSQFIGGTQKIVGLFTDLQYHKKTPIGPYTSQLSLGWQREQEQNAGSTRVVRDESHTLDDVTFTQLMQANVISGTVQVTNADHTQTYVLDSDYELQTTGAFTEIRRKTTGDIAADQAVLVTYSIAVAGDSTFDTTTLTWNNRLALEKVPLTPYYNIHRRADKLTGGQDPGNLDTQTTQLFGLQLDWKGLIVNVEHETRDQMLYPSSVADRVRARYQHRLTRDADLSLGGLIEKLTYDSAARYNLGPNGDRLDTTTAFARTTIRLRNSLLLRLSADYIKTQGRTNDERAEFKGQLEWNYRNIELSVEARQNFYQHEQNKGNEQAILFSIKRRF